MWPTEPHCSVMYQEDLKLENYANFCGSSSSWGDRSELCPVRDASVASSVEFTHVLKCLLLEFFFFFSKQTREEPCNPIYVWAAGWTTLPWKRLKLISPALSALPSWRYIDVVSVKTPPFSDDMGVKELVTIFLSARLSSSRSVLFNKRPGRWQWGVTMVVACDMHFGNNFFFLL